MTTYKRIHDALRENGIAALPNILKMKFKDTFGKINLGKEDMEYRVLDRIMPLFAAAHLGFSPFAIGTMMTALDVNLEDIDKGFEQGNLDIIARQKGAYAMPDPDAVDNSHFDGVTFLQQMVLAYNLSCPDAGEALQSTAAWLERGSTRMIAAMSLGVPQISCKTLMDDQADLVKAGLGLEIIDTAVLDIGNVCLNTSHPTHLPNGSMADFFAMTGAFTDHVIRKRMGASLFWEQLIGMSSEEDEMKALMLDHVINQHMARHPNQVKQMLMSYETSMAQDLSGVAGINAYEHLFNQLSETTMAPLLQEDAFIIEFLTEEMEQDERLSFLPGSTSDLTFGVGHPGVRAALERFARDPETLYQRLMLSQMHDSAIQASANHFKIWGKIKNVNFGPQRIDPDVANRYTLYMVSQLQTLRYPGYGASPDLDLSYDELNKSMRVITRKLERLFDYSLFKDLSQEERDDLILWNLDMNQLDISERAASKRLEMDLGL